MPRLNRLSLQLKTGKQSTSGPVVICFNGHNLELQDVKGSLESGAAFAGALDLSSFVHELALKGPEQGEWDVESLKVTYDVEGKESYEIFFEPFVLNGENQADIWAEPVRPSFEV